ncbi:MAG: hypothetical protein NDF54_05720 [archaeon GB-1867-035]|nr:hypothetical protein [Candidatus Culexmicrobium profundum]
MSFVGRAFTPAFLPLFFDVKSISNRFYYIGAGLNLYRGVSCTAKVKPFSCVKLNFLFGGKELNLPWIEEAVKRMLSIAGFNGVQGTLDFNFEVPLNFDLSLPTAALVSALAALHSALKLNIPAKAVIDVAQEIEFNFKIGFGTAFLQSIGGLVVAKGSGGNLPQDFLKVNYPKDIRIVVGSVSSIEMLFYPHVWDNFHLSEVLDDISSVNSFDSIVLKTKLFVEKFATDFKSINSIVEGLRRLNPIVCGLSLNGKLVYAICMKDEIIKFADFLLDFFPCEGIMAFEVDPVGTRVYL